MNLLNEMQKNKSRDAAAAKAEYVAIVRRASAGETKPEDAGVLAEITAQLGISEAQVAKDIANLETYIAAEKALESFPAPTKIGEVVAVAHAKRNARAEELAKAQTAFNDAQAAFNQACSLTTQRDLLTTILSDARKPVAHLLG